MAQGAAAKEKQGVAPGIKMPGTDQRDEWARALLEARAVSDEQFDRFDELAQEARGGGLVEAKALMATISSNPEDNGEGELVLSLLSGFPPDIEAKTILEELPRFEAQNETEWIDSIIETQARFRPAELVEAARKSSPEVISVLHSVLTRISSEAIAVGQDDPAGPLLRSMGYHELASTPRP